MIEAENGDRKEYQKNKLSYVMVETEKKRFYKHQNLEK